MDELQRLVSQVRDRFRMRVQVTLRPGVAFLYFGGNTALEVRVGETGRFDCTLLHPSLPVQTLQDSSSRIVLHMVDDLSHGRTPALGSRDLRPSSPRA